jgi:hypothetical protein
MKMPYLNKASLTLRGHFARLWIVIVLFMGLLFVALIFTPLPSLVINQVAVHKLKNLGFKNVQIQASQLTSTSLTFKQLSFSMPPQISTTQKTSPSSSPSKEHRFQIHEIQMTFENWDILRGKIMTLHVKKPQIQMVETPDLPDVKHIYKDIGEFFDDVRFLKKATITDGIFTL